jgi:hypothetical protein
MKILRFLLIAPFFAGASLVAQYAVPEEVAPTPPAPATVAPPAAPADPAVTVEAVLKALHYDEMIDKGMNQQKTAALTYTRQMLAKMNLPGTSKQDLEAFEQKALDAAWAGLKPGDIHAAAVRIYTEVFTADELQAMANFYGSPVGQSVTAKQPQAQQKIMAGLMPQMMQVAPKIQQMIRDFAAQQRAKAAEEAAKAAAAKDKDQKASGAPVAPVPAAAAPKP